MIETIAILLFPAMLLYAVYSDITTFKISNWVSIVIAVDFLLAAFATPLDLATIGLNLTAGLAMLVVGFGLFATRLLGGGDAKLLAASALWVGWSELLKYIVVVTVAGGGLALAIIFLRRMNLPDALLKYEWIRRLHSWGESIPYGVAIGVGGLWMFKDLLLTRPVAALIFGP